MVIPPVVVKLGSDTNAGTSSARTIGASRRIGLGLSRSVSR
jgi:hypothetical protein